MKGMELPINMIIIIAIAMLILVIVGAFFSGTFGGTVGSISLENALNQACSQLVTIYNCDDGKLGTISVNYKETGQSDATLKPLSRLCTLKLGSGYTIEACMRYCGCAAGW
jgi:hypothetical protein